MMFFSAWSWIALALVVLVLWWAHLAFWSKRLSTSVSYALEERLVMPDGGVIHLRRIQPLACAEPSAEPPVLLVHGLAVNHRNHDLKPECSFARYLAEQGRDVWLLTLRSGETPRGLSYRPRHSLEAMRDYDLPHAVAEVLARTGARELDLAGYSMGGIVIYAALGRSLEPRLIRRAVTFASPGRIRPLGLLAFARFIPPALTPPVPMRLVMRTLAFAHGVLPKRALRFFYNERNVPCELARACMVELFEDIPGRLGADFVRWAADQGRITVRGEPVLDGLAKVDVPMCFFAGTDDRLAPPEFVRAAFEAWGRDVPGLDKRFVLLGREHGASEDYGHGDFAFGRRAREEVFAPALAFLRGRDAEETRVVEAPLSAEPAREAPKVPPAAPSGHVVSAHEG